VPRCPGLLSGVPELRRPTTDVHESFVAAKGEFTAAGRAGSGDHTVVGAEARPPLVPGLETQTRAGL
jgi:hypothetical protein